MLRMLKQALTPEFLAKAPKGLLLIYDIVNEVTHLGWIDEITLEGDAMRAKLGLTAMQKHGEATWNCLESFEHETKDINSFTALPHFGGFHCADSGLIQGTFKIYPSSSIPPEYSRDYDQLVVYGNLLR